MKYFFLFLNHKQDAVLEADTEFWISICCEFNVQSQFQSMMKIIQYLTELPENKEGKRKTEPASACEPSYRKGQGVMVLN